MLKPIIPYNKQSIDLLDISAVNKVLKSKFLTQGPKNEIFCNKIKNFTKSKYAVVLNSATSALHTSCLALGLKKNEIIWTSSNTFISTATSGVHCGAKLDLVDINLKTGNLCINDLKRKLIIAKKKKSLPKILIVVHFAGIPCEMKEIWKLSKKYNFKIIEDASHALGSIYHKNVIGNCRYSDVCVFSFHPIKSITTFEGGAITTNSKSIFNSCKLISNHGIVKNISKKKKWLYDQKMLGYNFRLSDVACALGISQMKKLGKFISKRNKIANFYYRNLKNLPIELPEIKPGIYNSFHLFVISINNNYRDDFYNYMLKENIQLQFHYIPLYNHSFFAKKFNFKKKNFKNMEYYFKHNISLPIYVDIKKVELLKITEKIRKFFKKKI